MAPSKPIQIRLTEEQRAALDAYCIEHHVELSHLARAAMLKAIGRKDLIEQTRPEGRPRKLAERTK